MAKKELKKYYMYVDEEGNPDMECIYDGYDEMLEYAQNGDTFIELTYTRKFEVIEGEKTIKELK